MESLQKSWWLVTVRGVLALLFGLLALFSPYIVIFSLITFFAFFAIISGFFILTLAFLGETDNKGLRILEGLIFLGAGIVVSALGGIMIFIAAWAILSGLIQIIGAIKLRKVISNEWFMILNGVISVLFGIVLAGNLVTGAGVMLMIFGAFAILSGIFTIILSFKIKSYKP
ncbi:MAG TPA: DUF308 domain-containing protein [Ignavibacteria bacterium]|nr:DUF308 domain-containing protein [Ignavibacteria bacterium]